MGQILSKTTWERVWESTKLKINFGGVRNKSFNDGLNKTQKSTSWNLNKIFETLNDFG